MTVALATALSGCGTHRVQPSDSATATYDSDIPPTPAASDYVSAILNSRTRGSAKVNTTTTIDTSAGERSVRGTGSAFLVPGYGVMTWSVDGSSFVELVNDDGIFVQSEQPDGRWTHVVVANPKAKNEPVGTTTTSGGFDPLRGLGVLENVVDDGTQNLGKVSATRYSGNLPVTPDELRAMGLTEDEISEVGDAWHGVDQHVTVWIDPNGLVSRVDRSVEIPDATNGSVSMTSTATIRDFGSMLDVTSPSSNLVDTATATPE